MTAKPVKYHVLALALLLGVGASTVSAQAADIALSDADNKAIRAKLTEVGMKKERSDMLLKQVKADNEAAIYSEDGKIVALQISALSSSDNATMRAKMNQAKVKGLNLKVLLAGMMFGLASKYSADDFPSRELILPALELNGFEMQGDFKPETYSREGFVGDSAVWAFAAINADAVDAFKSNLPDAEKFKALYERVLMNETINSNAEGDFDAAVRYGRQAIARKAPLTVEFVLSYLEALQKQLESKINEAKSLGPLKDAVSELGAAYLIAALEKPLDNIRLINVVTYADSDFDIKPHFAVIYGMLEAQHKSKDYAPSKALLAAFDTGVVYSSQFSLLAAKCSLETDSTDTAKRFLRNVFADGVELTLENWLLAGHVANKLGMDKQASTAAQKAYELSLKEK
ncbi:hypothetical protein OAU50_01620 [Planctomycetota bacterium]|nr:hypothetical protein [Planctomycetota bacterium]